MQRSFFRCLWPFSHRSRQLASAAFGVRQTKVMATNSLHSSSAATHPVPKTQQKNYRSVVVGAGPAGVAAVGCLLDAGATPILWVDPSFSAGRLHVYTEVPSNTKVKLFIEYVRACQAFAKYTTNSFERKNNPIEHLLKLAPNRGCVLANAAEMILRLTENIRLHETDRVRMHRGTVVQLCMHERQQLQHNEKKFFAASWTVVLEDSERFSNCESVLLCTGSAPRGGANLPQPPPHIKFVRNAEQIRELGLDDVLAPSRLASLVCADDVVAVVGGSHSAILALKNFAEMDAMHRPCRIKHFHREPLKYAVEQPGDWILYDNTGLKGDAADWARRFLDVAESAYPAGLSRHRLSGSSDEHTVYTHELHDVTKIVYAIGYERNPLPQILADERTEVSGIEHDFTSGQLLGRFWSRNDENDASKRRSPLPGLFGYGIAFPERTVDPLGNREDAVGFWKFSRYLRRIASSVLWASPAERRPCDDDDFVRHVVESDEPKKPALLNHQKCIEHNTNRAPQFLAAIGAETSVACGRN